MTPDVESVPGLNDLTRWFGSFPSFHDAEVTWMMLDRSKQSRIAIHAFEETDKVDSRGFGVCTKHAIVTFVLEGIVDATVEGFNRQNVLNGLSFDRTAEGFRLVLEGSHGANATLNAERVQIELQPGIPDDSLYLRFRS